MNQLIDRALSELEEYPLSWNASVHAQLNYCADVLSDKAEPDKLEELNIGLIAVREISEDDPLHSLLTKIQFKMQKQYLPYAAQVRLNIHVLKNT